MMIPMIGFLKLFIDMIGGMDSMVFKILRTEGSKKRWKGFVRDFDSELRKVYIKTNEHNTHRSL